MALSKCGQLLTDWFQTSLILGEELALYIILVFVCCLLVLLLHSSHNLTPILVTLWIFPASLDTIIVWMVGIALWSLCG